LPFFIYLYHGGKGEGVYLPACHKLPVGGHFGLDSEVLTKMTKDNND